MSMQEEIIRLKAEIAELEAKINNDNNQKTIVELRRKKARLIEQLRVKERNDKVILG